MDYSNSKIYKIVCNVSGLVYIGSTTQPLCKRLGVHKSKYKLWKSDKIRTGRCSSFEIIEYDSYDIVLIENYPCFSKEEFHRRERHYIQSMVCVNKRVPTRTLQEYYIENKERRKEYNKNLQKKRNRNKKWEKNNHHMDIELYKTIFWKRMAYVLVDIKKKDKKL